MVNSGNIFQSLIYFLLLIFAPLITVSLLALPVGACSRSDFGSYSQMNYKDTRARMLELHATGPITHRIGSGGKYIVENGSWTGAFSGRELTNVSSSVVQIDHVIPVMWACDHGADRWAKEKRREFYNDMRFLLVVESGINNSKGAKGPDEFVPYKPDMACNYITLFLAGVREYDLTMSAHETATILTTHSATCGASIASN